MTIAKAPVHIERMAGVVHEYHVYQCYIFGHLKPDGNVVLDVV